MRREPPFIVNSKTSNNKSLPNLEKKELQSNKYNNNDNKDSIFKHSILFKKRLAFFYDNRDNHLKIGLKSNDFNDKYINRFL